MPPWRDWLPSRAADSTCMSIATKTGDQGVTGLMYNRRIRKDDPRVEAYGCVDELNAALGLARSASRDPAAARVILGLQHGLVVLMGELATAVEDLERYEKDGFKRIGPGDVSCLDAQVKELESRLGRFTGWAMPGGSRLGAALDLARTICRRAERRVCALLGNDQLRNPEVITYLNRLADVLWLMSREAERPKRRPHPGLRRRAPGR